MMTYTPNSVERMLRSYLDIRMTLETTGTEYRADVAYSTQPVFVGDVPLGRTQSNPTWPFLTKPYAPRVADGKRLARQMEELHCVALDIEAALPRVSEEDRWIIINHVILQQINLEELAQKLHLRGTSGARMRVQRAIVRLTRVMEHLYVNT